MNIFSVSGLLISILCAILGVLALAKGKKSIHYIWAFFSFSVALWGFGSYKIGIAQSPESAIFWWRIGYIGVILIPVFFIHFVHKFLDLTRKWIIKIVYSFGLLFLIVNFFGDLFIRRVQFLFNQFYYISSPTILYNIFVFSFVGLIIYSHIELLKAYSKSKGIKKDQIKYFLLATIPGFLAGAFEFLPVYKMELYPYLHFIIAFSPLTVTYAILRYRLMDLRIVARKIATYLLSAGFVYGIFFFLVWLFERYFGGVFTSATYLSGLIITPMFVVVLLWFYSLVQKTANKYLFFNLYSHQETIAKLTDELTNSIDLNKIVDSIVNSIKQAMQLDMAGILLIDQNGEAIRYKIARVIGFNEKNGISLVEDNFLTQYLQKTQKPLVRDELQMIAKDLNNPTEQQRFLQLSENMKRIEASLCLPMIISNKLIGIIVLGSKVSGDAYTNEDLNLLNTLSKQAAIAVDNARLYREVQDFNKTLQQKVDEQTKDIKKAYEVEKEAHNELKKLDEAKTNFMLVTQHHLRTPLTATRGFLDLLLDGSYGKIPKKISEVIDRTNKSVQREIDVVNDLLAVSTFQLGDGGVHPDQNVSIKKTAEEIISELKPEADEKHIYLKLEGTENIPEIFVDQKQVRMALQNIIDNAVKYTKKGGVEVKIKTENEKIIVEVKDTGIGMEPEDKKYLFDKPFQRSKDAWTANAVGKGIGVYLSAKIIEAHGGKIWAESEGRGKGTTFNIELPINVNVRKINQFAKSDNINAINK